MGRNILFALAGALVGWLVASVGIRDGEPAGRRVEFPVRAGPARAPQVDVSLEPPRRPPAPVGVGPPSGRRVTEGIFGEALLEHFEKGFRRGWGARRSRGPATEDLAEGERTFRRVVEVLPEEIGRKAAEEANGRDALDAAPERHEGLAALEAAAAGTYDLGQAVRDPEWLDRVLEPRAESGLVDGADLAGDQPVSLRAGTTVAFGPGVHELEERRLRGPDGRTLPADVAVTGAGMDATLLRIGDISISGDVERLAFRDMTIDAGNDGLFDLRSGRLLLSLERVRVVRFDAGHGGCHVFYVGQGALVRARDSRFVGGYGRSPGSGDLYRGQPFAARFENCTFELLEMPAGPNGSVLYAGCTFDLLTEDPIARGVAGGRFVGCTFHTPIQWEDRGRYARKLSDLFPEAGDG